MQSVRFQEELLFKRHTLEIGCERVHQDFVTDLITKKPLPGCPLFFGLQVPSKRFDEGFSNVWSQGFFSTHRLDVKSRFAIGSFEMLFKNLTTF